MISSIGSRFLLFSTLLLLLFARLVFPPSIPSAPSSSASQLSAKLIASGISAFLGPDLLTNDLHKFVTGSPDGFIYFSLGTVISGSTLPPKTKNEIISVLSRLKQRVIWKWEGEVPEGLPKNVIVRKWLPQQDLLGHPNIRLFISHGGLLSTQQTIYHGVPVIFFPLFFDQIANAKNAILHGFAILLDMWNFSEVEFEKAIHRVLKDSSFKENAQTISAAYKDQMNNPTERGVFWTNFVLKHKGAPQLRSSARKLNFIQFHSIDVIAFLMAIAVFILIITIYILKLLKRVVIGLVSPNVSDVKNAKKKTN